jgi:hypothetical protein
MGKKFLTSAKKVVWRLALLMSGALGNGSSRNLLKLAGSMLG